MDGSNVHPRSVVVRLPVSSSAISLVLMTLVERCFAVHTRSDVFATHPSSSAVRNGRDRYLAFLVTAICGHREHSHTSIATSRLFQDGTVCRDSSLHRADFDSLSLLASQNAGRRRRGSFGCEVVGRASKCALAPLFFLDPSFN